MEKRRGIAVEIYEFRPAKVFVLLDKISLAILDGSCREGVTVEPLGRRLLVEKCGSSTVILKDPQEGYVFPVNLDVALRLAKRERDIVVAGPDGVIGRAEVWSGQRFYKLAYVPLGEATIELDGIHMHRVSGTTPLRDAAAKVRLVVRKGSRVLDVCTGLGYTAVASTRRGARLVYTVELDENILALGMLNPRSWDLANPKIRLVRGDALDVLPELEREAFDTVIHDPPRFTGETSPLYSLELYLEFYRVLMRGGRLFHYTGEPGRLRGRNLPGRVASLLREAGFKVLGYKREALGIIAIKA